MLRRDNPMGIALVSVLVFEALIFALAVPAMIQVAGVPWQPAIAWGVVGAVIALVGALLLRRGWLGWILGWITQVLVVGTGIVVSLMFFVGGMFALVWVISFVLGKRLESGRADR